MQFYFLFIWMRLTSFVQGVFSKAAIVIDNDFSPVFIGRHGVKNRVRSQSPSSKMRF